MLSFPPEHRLQFYPHLESFDNLYQLFGYNQQFFSYSCAFSPNLCFVIIAFDDKILKEKELQNTLYLVREALARKIVFMPIDLYKSDARAFTIEDGKIRLPFSTLNGLGERAAQSIVEARVNGEFSSKEDLKNRAQLSKSVLDVFDKVGVTSSMTETDQLTFF